MRAFAAPLQPWLGVGNSTLKESGTPCQQLPAPAQHPGPPRQRAAGWLVASWPASSHERLFNRSLLPPCAAPARHPGPNRCAPWAGAQVSVGPLPFGAAGSLHPRHPGALVGSNHCITHRCTMRHSVRQGLDVALQGVDPKLLPQPHLLCASLRGLCSIHVSHANTFQGRCLPAFLTPQDAFAVRIFEEIVRFHILSEHELCAQDQSGGCAVIWC